MKCRATFTDHSVREALRGTLVTTISLLNREFLIMALGCECSLDNRYLRVI